MTQKTINITIDKLGNAKVEANGFTGRACEDATKAIEQALAGGGATVEKEFKPERNMGGGSEQKQEQRW